MKPDFFLAYHSTISIEGGYSFDANDPGGETWKGISRKKWPEWEGWKIVDEIRRNTTPGQFVHALEADEELQDLHLKFYKEEFWDKQNLDLTGVHELSEEIFDTAVNQGPVTAGKYLQQSLNLLNRNGKDYPDIKVVDGKIGSTTLNAFNAYMSVPGRSLDRNVKTLLKVMNWFQMERYIEICEAKPEQEIYLYGWLNRV